MGRRRSTRVLLGTAMLGAAAVLGYALWWCKNPSACPYGLRFFVELPHPFVTRARLREVLNPKPGDRVREVGPGTGYYALHVAAWLGPGGTLDVLDVQQEMLDHRRAGRARRASRASSRPGATPKHSRTRTEPSTPPT